MKLSDVMSAANLTSWAEWGLLISFFTFMGIIAYVFVVRRGKDTWDRERSLPLDNEYRVGDDYRMDHNGGQR